MAKQLIYAVLMAAMLLPFVGAAPTYTGGGGAVTSPGIVLPDSMFTAVGRELNIWNGQLSPIPYLNYPFYYSVVADEGQAENRGYRWTATAADTTTATVRAYDYGANLIQQLSLKIEAVRSNVGVGQKKVMFVGDSLFDGNGLVAEVDSLFGLDGGGDTVMIGTQVDVGAYHEAHGGKTWAWFSESTSPFWDAGNARLDFQNYSTTQLGGLEPDYMVINLGGNEVLIAAAAGNSVNTATIITQATAFLDTLFSATYGFPNCRVIINLMPTAAGLPSAFGAAGNYNAEWSPALWFNGIRAVSRSYITAFDAGGYSNLVDVCAAGTWVDPDYGYSVTGSVAVSARSFEEETTGDNFVHPTTSGNDQLSDALYSHLRYFHEMDEPTGCTNELDDSHNFDNATYWEDRSTYWTPATGQADPWGGTTATKFTATAAVVTVSIGEQDRWQHGGDITFSAFVEKGNLTAADATEIDLRNDTSGITHSARITWATPPTFSKSASVDDGGLIHLGGDWYQLWGTFDNTSYATDDMYLRIFPCPGTSAVNDEIYIVGGQVEYGVTEPCGIYVETP